MASRLLCSWLVVVLVACGDIDPAGLPPSSAVVQEPLDPASLPADILITPVIFDRAWSAYSDGAPVAGQVLRVDYDPQRLPQCRSRYGGGRAWNIQMSWIFRPGGEHGATGLYDVGTRADADPIRPLLAIPRGATQVELWFVNTDRAGCVAYDSNFGANHLFAISPQPRTVGWAGSWRGRFSHACRDAALPNPVVFYKSGAGHDCMQVLADAWSAGITDTDGSARLRAEVETDLGFGDGPSTALTTYPLTLLGRTGNNQSYVWNVAQHVSRSARGSYRFRYRFSADAGRTWLYLGAAAGDWRTLHIRNDSSDQEDILWCEGVERWHDATNVFPACLSYQPYAHTNAEHCELWVNAFGRGQWSHGQAHVSWHEAYIKVAPAGSTVLEVGMWSSYTDSSGQPRERLSLGVPVEPGYYKTGFTRERNGQFDYTPGELAFFTDIQLTDGRIVRFWESQHGDNYDLAEAFPSRGWVESLGGGSIEYAPDDAPVLESRWRCP